MTRWIKYEAGLVAPDGFPVTDHKHTLGVVGGVAARGRVTKRRFGLYSAAWRGVLYRYRTATESADRFSRLLARTGDGPRQPVRFRQDEALAHLEPRRVYRRPRGLSPEGSD